MILATGFIFPRGFKDEADSGDENDNCDELDKKSGLFYYVTLYKPPHGQRFAIHYAENHLMSHLFLLKILISSMKN